METSELIRTINHHTTANIYQDKDTKRWKWKFYHWVSEMDFQHPNGAISSLIMWLIKPIDDKIEERWQQHLAELAQIALDDELN